MIFNEETSLIVTGGAGFIGSNFISALNEKGVTNIVIVDNFSHSKEKWKNLVGLEFDTVTDISSFYESIVAGTIRWNFDAIVHLGARADTREEFDALLDFNYKASIFYMNLAIESNIPIYYASSASTYGNTDLFSDNHALISMLRPNNAYGMSKHIFDRLVLHQAPQSMCGMKFFNVFGPNEMHKGNMASIIGRILNTDEDFILYDVEGWSRDFIYVEDVVSVILYLMESDARGIYNVGTGVTSSWEDVYDALLKVDPGLKKRISIKSPQELPSFFGEGYQTYSKADLTKLRDHTGYKKKFLSLTEGIKRYKLAIQ